MKWKNFCKLFFVLLLPLCISLAGCSKTPSSAIYEEVKSSTEIPAPSAPSEPVSTTPVKILPKEQTVYHGVFLGDGVITLDKIKNFETMSGKKVDIVLKFLAFSEMGVNGGFPISEAKVVYEYGAVLFIKLEPWSYAGVTDKSFSLEDIIAGKYDGRIANFANEAAKFKKPIFVTFGHEMNAKWYPWGGNSELYKQAYKYVYNLMNKYANNITWVWNPNVEGENFANYYPGDSYVDWVAIDGYNTEDYSATWKSAEQIFNASIVQLEYFNKPIMIGETACDANNDYDENVRKPDWLYDAIQWIVNKKKVDSGDNLIKAYVYFNFDKVEGGQLKRWAISTSVAQNKYREALTIFSDFFKGL